MSFSDHIRNWSADDLSHLMESRPDLIPASDRGLEAVARKAGTAMSLGRALVGADVGMLVVAEALVAKYPATINELDELLGTRNITAVADAVERLRRTGVVVVEGGVIFPVGSLSDLLHRPLGLGPSFEELAENVPTKTIEQLAATTRSEGAGNRSPTIRAITHRLREPAVLETLLSSAPEASQDLLQTLVSHRSPAIPLPTGYPYRGLDGDDPLAWLVEQGLVVAVTESGAELPREIVMAAMADGLAPQAVLLAPDLIAVDGLPPDVVSGSAADSANLLLDGAETLLHMIGDGEVSIRKAGGVGPREIKRLAKLCRLEAIDVARLFELLAVARLLKVVGGNLGVSDLSSRWWAMARRRRYLVLVRAWLASDRFLSRGLTGHGDSDHASSDKLVALGDAEPVAAVAAGRAVTMSTICDLPDGSAYQPEQLAESVVWQGPNLWGAGEPLPETLVDWTLAEAELLGLISGRAPSPLLRALTAADEVLVDQLAAVVTAEDQDKFVLQSDMTAVAFGPLVPAVGRSLADMTERTDAVGDGRTPTFRFTEASMRQAFDRGWERDSITGFLTEHSLAGIPQPLGYLLEDVARRYGSIKVMPCQSVIVTADDIAAVEIAANRKAAKLGLRLIAPTVLTSPLDPVTVTEALRALGLFPTLDGSSVSIDPNRGPSVGSPGDADPGASWTGTGAGPDGFPSDGASSGRAAADGSAAELPADWTGPPIPAGPFPDEISEAVSLLLEPDGQAPGDRTPDGKTPDANTARDGSSEEKSGQRESAPVLDDRVPGWSDRRLQGFWGRSITVDALIDGSLQPVNGTLIGLGAVVSLLTVNGVVELPVETILTISDPGSV